MRVRAPVGILVIVGLLGLSAPGKGEPDPGTEPRPFGERIEAFQEVRIVPESGRFLLTPGEFPRLDWEHPHVVRDLWGEFPLRVRWFDSQGNEVSQADSEGRYAAYIEGITPTGQTVRRGKTFFCLQPETLMSLLGSRLVETPEKPLLGTSEAAWNAHDAYYREFANQAVLRAWLSREEAAILAAALHEWEADAEKSPLEVPAVRHQEHHLNVKRKILGLEEAYPELVRPKKTGVASTELREGTPGEVGFAADFPQKLRRLCREWEETAGEPFTIVVARNGRIAFHEAFGQRDGTLVSSETVYPLFSQTKSLAGLLLLLFVDQGLLDLDAPVGVVLPDFPLEGDGVFSLRQSMMHASGLSGHGNWRGLNNPWLENVVANGLEDLTPAYAYSGLAYDLVGVAMQLVSGKSVARLFEEHLFGPLAMKGAVIDDLGAGGRLRAIDLARAGQLILNGGAYGDYTFFSPATLEEFLPQSYEDHFPGLAPDAPDYGLGIRWAPRRHPEAGQGEIPEEATLLSPRTIGHGSLSGSVFRVDLETNLVVAIGRFHAGERHGEYLDAILQLLAENLLAEPFPQ